MATAKTADRKRKVAEQNDLNVGQLNMGNWSTREMRKPKASGKPKGKGSIKVIKPPIGGWTGGNS